MLGLLNSRQSNGANFVSGLVPFDCRLRLLEYFSESFSQKEAAFSFFCFIHSLDKTFFVPYLSPSHVKCYLNSENFPPFKKIGGKMFVTLTSSMRLSSNRS